MQVKVNGRLDEIPEESSINDVLTARSIPLEIAIVALNGNIVRREEWEGTMLHSHDDLEIIRVVGGG